MIFSHWLRSMRIPPNHPNPAAKPQRPHHDPAKVQLLNPAMKRRACPAVLRRKKTPNPKLRRGKGKAQQSDLTATEMKNPRLHANHTQHNHAPSAIVTSLETTCQSSAPATQRQPAQNTLLAAGAGLYSSLDSMHWSLEDWALLSLTTRPLGCFRPES